MHPTTHLTKGAAAALLLAAGVSAAPSPGTAVTCENNASNNTVYTAQNAQFDILCGIDYSGGDMGAERVSTFAECITRCDSTPGCINVAFAPWGMCWLKNQNTTPSPNSGVWTAKSKAALTGLTCIDNFSDKKTYTSPGGTAFDIACGVDYAGGDMSSRNTNTFKECVDACGSTPGCVNVAYSAPSCYLKSAMMAPRTNSHVWAAVRKDADADPLTCENKKWDAREFTTKDNRVYSIGCGDDYAGGDMAAVDSATFQGCLEACDAASGCINVAYVAPRCYLKNVANPPAKGTHVWGAKFLRVNVPTPPAPTPYTCNPCSPVMLNPSFDDGTNSWTQRDVSNSVISSISAGSVSGSAVQVVSTRGYAVLAQKLSVVTGSTYSLTVDYMFSAAMTNCYLNAFINGGWFWSFSPRYEPTSVGAWKKSPVLQFTASACDTELAIQFVCTAGESVTMKLDNIKVTGGPTCPAKASRSLRGLERRRLA
ncbi:hypothetical protein NEMBOFW57_008630 [Staphylotrichum longicolle]|uniref:Apple domain-containing protein n=1 Tax=Staphylotrichum longicolle TaxID=669026 RepID=A0AAD4HWT2_9PEZI|nr:hypothetical protein NEMBOFW57_008630 [Staphylotrichum longicolle]